MRAIVDIMRPLPLISTIVVFFLVFSPVKALADSINWQKYMKSAAVISAIASGVSLIGECNKPLQYSESKVDGKLRLNINCIDKEGESTVIIEFESLGKDLLVPSRFFLAG